MSTPAEILAGAGKEGLEMITQLKELCKSDPRSPLKPNYVDRANAVILTASYKGGLGFGFAGGSGILLVRLPRLLGEPPRWSAPIFLKLAMAGIGLSVGFQYAQTLTLCLGTKMLDQLLEGRHSVIGIDQSVVAFYPRVEERNDLIEASMTEGVDIITVSQASGLMVKLSLQGGGLSIDEAKMKEVYGEGVSVKQVARGEGVGPVTELEGLYETLGAIVKEANKE